MLGKYREEVGFGTYDIAVFDHTVPDPDTMSTHHVRHHHVCEQPVTHNGYLLRLRDLGVRPATEVVHDFTRASGLLRGMPEHRDSSILLQEFSILKTRIRASTR